MGRPRKRFGQHWLRDQKILQKIVEAATIEKCDRVLEIGPGQGILTKSLVSLSDTVIAVEIDRDLCRTLNIQFEKDARFHLIQGDILDLDLDNLLSNQPDVHPPDIQHPNIQHPNIQHPNKVVANIPYYITGPLLEKLLGRIRQPNPRPFDSIVLLLQKEVADRLYAPPGTKTFGALSVRVQYLADCELICPVPAKSFKPPPKVESAVVRLRPRPFPMQAQNPKLLEQLVKVGFSQKRKMLRNNLKGLINRDQITDHLEAMALNPQARAEDLSVPSWVTLSNRVSEMMK
ncbi:MAG: 16S rRNA (adenine(1518)-N(6)/adenine(1519)-N(6))-dimethyltransferase RsmA [Cyanobacteria bacterium P01_A01_bin.114]